MITYDRLWETMKKRGITQYHLIKREKFSAGQIGRLKNNMTVSTQTLDTLCRLLSCRIEDIVTYIPDNGETLLEQNPAVESISQCSTDPDANTDTGTDISKEKKVPSLYAKAKKGTKISKKSAKKASKIEKGEKTDKSDKGEKGDKKAKKKNKDKDKDKKLGD